MFAMLPVTLFAMLILLMIQLQRFSRMLLALMMAPFGLIGIVLAMLPTGTPMGFVALLGVIALAGMIIRNAVILIDEVDQQLPRRHGEQRRDYRRRRTSSPPDPADRLCGDPRDDPDFPPGILGADGLRDHWRTDGRNAGNADGAACGMSLVMEKAGKNKPS